MEAKCVAGKVIAKELIFICSLALSVQIDIFSNLHSQRLSNGKGSAIASTTCRDVILRDSKTKKRPCNDRLENFTQSHNNSFSAHAHLTFGSKSDHFVSEFLAIYLT